MMVCPRCGHDAVTAANFCPACGRPLTVPLTAPREERKVVTVLFADLVGFTARSEAMDPEDVRAFLSPYYARLRSELERFGGTVEKFIGDAVMAVFGAPVSHEDDPERAVRAALAIRDWVVEQGEGLQLRIAVNTGEVLVALEARPGHGEGMVSGDVVNTTARLQTAAPVNGVLVGETTYRATATAITYRAAAPVTAKGKREPVAAWEAQEARARLGVDLRSTSRTPLVGRRHELGVLREALGRVRRERSLQLLTLVGVPGIGKSRLLAELFESIEEDPEAIVLWRQGRSLPYGEGVTFWALAEMVKAQAGILETDAPEQAEAKLHASVAELVPDPTDAPWVEAHLRPLAGLSSDSEAGGGTDRREEAFTAWRRYLEGLADTHPLVLVFEDLHWADDNLLDFIEHLVEWASGVPVLIVCTARPELFGRRAGWAGGTRHATTLSLAPLSEEETAAMISSLSQRALVPAELLARAGGNPLYAEQYVRMIAERGTSEELALPETVQGIIAARLDALPAAEKGLLQGAAVLGKVFWVGALLEDGGLDRHGAEGLLHALERNDFVQRARRSSVAEEVEYAFLHVLVRDVAYGQIPRGRRAEQHRRAAAWIEALGRTEDHAEMLAHHYLRALELLRATGQPADAALSERALERLRAAGDRAVALNAYASAAGFYESALELAPAGTSRRAQLLFTLGRMRLIGGDLDPRLLRSACDSLAAAGDQETAAEAQAALAELHWFRGDTERCAQHLAHAQALVAGREPSRATISVASVATRYLTLAGDSSKAIPLGRQVLAMAEQLGLDDFRAHALNYLGVARVMSSDLAGIDDLEQSLAIALESSAPEAINRAHSNLAGSLLECGDLKRAFASLEEAAAVASRFGLMGSARWVRGERPEYHHYLGRWDEGLAEADDFLAEVEAGAPHYSAVGLYAVRSQIRLGRDDVRGAALDAERALQLAALIRDAQAVFPTLATCAHTFREIGNLQRASTLADEFLAQVERGRNLAAGPRGVHVMAWTFAALGRGSELSAVLPKSDNRWVRAARAFSEGDLRRAADTCAEMGAVTEEARDRLWLAEVLIGQNRRVEADVELQRALAFYRSAGATRYIREAEGLLNVPA